MKPMTLALATLTVKHWMLMLALFAVSSFCVDGFVAIAYAVLAWIASTFVFIFYPLALRLLCLLRRPWLGLALLLASLMAVNDWLFLKVSASSSSSSSMESPVSLDFLQGDGTLIRICVQVATVLSTLALRQPITEYLQTPNPHRQRLADADNVVPS